MASSSVYELSYGYDAIDLNHYEWSGVVVTKFFDVGDLVVGKPFKKEWILIDDQFLIPFDYAEKTDKVPYLKKGSDIESSIQNLKQQAVLLSEKERERLESNGRSLKDVVEGKASKKVQEEAKAYKNGAFIGLASGLLLGLYFKRSLVLFGIGGFILGGYVATRINKSKGEFNVVEPIS